MLQILENDEETQRAFGKMQMFARRKRLEQDLANRLDDLQCHAADMRCTFGRDSKPLSLTFTLEKQVADGTWIVTRQGVLGYRHAARCFEISPSCPRRESTFTV